MIGTACRSCVALIVGCLSMGSAGVEIIRAQGAVQSGPSLLSARPVCGAFPGDSDDPMAIAGVSLGG